MVDGVQKPIEEVFDLTQEEVDELNYHHFERYTDAVVALDYEGYPEHQEYFSDEQWELNHEFQKIYLSQRETQDSMRLEISRLLRKPIAEMR